MDQSQGRIATVLKRLLFRQATKRVWLQPLWRRLHTLSVFGMNYGGGGLIESSGEQWLLSNVVGPALASTSDPVVFDVGANVGEYAMLVMRASRGATIYAFEPSASVYELLVRKFEASGLTDRAQAFNLGLSDANKTTDLYSYTVDGA